MSVEGRTALILCGGRGLRALPHTAELPKPLLDVGGRPILHHLMEIFSAQGCTAFVLAAGHQIDLLRSFAEATPQPWRVDVVDTGVDTGTGERVAQCLDRLDDGAFVTYGDGLADIDLAALASFHASHAGAMTVTTVALPSPYGTIDVGSTGAVERFSEKPILPDHLINAGFFVLDRAVADHWDGTDLEREVLPHLAAAGQLFAYRHDGFWRSMDTYKDAVELAAMYDGGRAPWMPSKATAPS